MTSFLIVTFYVPKVHGFLLQIWISIILRISSAIFGLSVFLMKKLAIGNDYRVQVDKQNGNNWDKW